MKVSLGLVHRCRCSKPPAAVRQVPQLHLCSLHSAGKSSLQSAGGRSRQRCTKRNVAPRSAGVALTTCHGLFATEEAVPPEPSYRGIVHNFRTMSPAALEKMGFPGLAQGWAFESIVADQSVYLPWLQAATRSRVTRLEKRLSHLGELDAEGTAYDVVFNCSGAYLPAICAPRGRLSRSFLALWCALGTVAAAAPAVAVACSNLPVRICLFVVLPRACCHGAFSSSAARLAALLSLIPSGPARP